MGFSEEKFDRNIFAVKFLLRGAQQSAGDDAIPKRKIGKVLC